MMINIIGFLILKPGGHPGIVEKNVKLSMACHHSVHSPRFEKIVQIRTDVETNLRREAGFVVSSGRAGAWPCLSRSFTKSGDLSGLRQVATTFRNKFT